MCMMRENIQCYCSKQRIGCCFSAQFIVTIHYGAAVEYGDLSNTMSCFHLQQLLVPHLHG